MSPGLCSVRQEQVTAGLGAIHPGDCDAGFLKPKRHFSEFSDRIASFSRWASGTSSGPRSVGYQSFSRPSSGRKLDML